MTTDTTAIDVLIAKEAIRELVLLYSRGCDRQDFDLVRTLYTADATDSHDESFDGKASDYVDFLARSLPHALYSGHHVCNHLISVNPAAGTGEGEVYALAWHVIPDRAGGWLEDFMCCRYIDRYARGEDGRWQFAKRVVKYDLRTVRPYATDGVRTDPMADPSFLNLTTSLFTHSAMPVSEPA